MQYLKILSKYSRFGEPVKDLSRIVQLCSKLDNPHRKFKSVHVTGTNGKGSVCEYVYCALLKEHMNVGKFASPYVRVFNERVQIGSDYVSDEMLRGAIEEAAAAAPPKLGYSQFEILTAAAFLLFARQGVEYAVIEAGIGGALDCTNIITPVVSVITSVSFDHTEILGNTIMSIARNKAGIIKWGVPVVIGELPAEALIAVRERVNALGGAEVAGTDVITKIITADRTKFTPRACSIFGNDFDYRTVRVTTKLSGEHQITNALTAFEVCRCLDIPARSIKAGFACASLPGRAEIVVTEPLIIVDGAHNEEGLSAFRNLLLPLPFFKVFIVGMTAGKDALALTPLLSHERMVIVTDGFDNAMPCEVIVNVCARAGVASENIFTTSSLSGALEMALNVVGGYRGRDALDSLVLGNGDVFFGNDANFPYINSRRYKTARYRDAMIVVAGSLYLAGAALRLLDDMVADGFFDCPDDDDDDMADVLSMRMLRLIMGNDDLS